jgi:hypothetical protein
VLVAAHDHDPALETFAANTVLELEPANASVVEPNVTLFPVK